jgi:hypothetical protein
VTLSLKFHYLSESCTGHLKSIEASFLFFFLLLLLLVVLGIKSRALLGTGGSHL